MITRQLAQTRPSGTSAESIFTSGGIQTHDRPYKLHSVIICNVSGSTLNMSLFHDVDGSTYDESTALFFEYPMTAGQTLIMSEPLTDYQIAGNLGGQSSVANGITFTVYGEIQGEQL